MDHAYFKDRLSALFDNELPPQEKQVVEEHVRDCAECRAELAKLQRFEDVVKRHSELGDTDYWEKSAQKIEQQLGFQQQTVITPIKHRWYERGLGWKALAAAASIGVLAYIGINSDKILKRENLEPKPAPVEQKATDQETGASKTKGTPAPIMHGVRILDTAAARRYAEAQKLAETVEQNASASQEEKAQVSAYPTESTAVKIELAPPPPAPKDINLSMQAPKETVQQTKQKIVTNLSVGNAPASRAPAASSAQSVVSPLPVADTAARIVKREPETVKMAIMDTVRTDSTLNWWRKKRDALLEVRKALPGVGAFSGLSKMAAPSKLTEDRKKQPQMTESEVEKQLLEAWYYVAGWTRDEAERERSIAEIRKVADKPKSPNQDLAARYLKYLGVK